MFTIEQSESFEKWFDSLRDKRAVKLITARLARLAGGHFGDVKSLKNGISELRMDYGPGYRIYFQRRDEKIILLLSGGDKGSQERDIENARTLAKQWDEDNG